MQQSNEVDAIYCPMSSIIQACVICRLMPAPTHSSAPATLCALCMQHAAALHERCIARAFTCACSARQSM